MQGFVLYSHSQVCGDCGGNSQLFRNSLHKLSQERGGGAGVEAEASQEGPWSSRLQVKVIEGGHIRSHQRRGQG